MSCGFSDLSLLRGCWNWAIRVGYLDKTPFKRGSEAVIKLSREPSRSRRLEKDEAERLLAACGSHLRSITEAALESGARKGELLSLQWWQVREGTRPELFFQAAKTKARRDRCVPISMRLKMILDMRLNDPSGQPMPNTAYVFGNEIGQRMTTIKTAWSSARRRAAITDLHFHDLRREAGSRWLEGGVPLQMIRDWLGHSNIAQTSTYLGSTIQGQHDAMRRFEERRAAAAERPHDATSHQTGGPMLGERTSGARPKVQ
jgi:integrase